MYQKCGVLVDHTESKGAKQLMLVEASIAANSAIPIGTPV